MVLYCCRKKRGDYCPNGLSLCYQFIEALSDGGVRRVCRATFRPSWRRKPFWAGQNGFGNRPASRALKDQVTSPGGTTIEAARLGKGKLRGTVMSRRARRDGKNRRKLGQG